MFLDDERPRPTHPAWMGRITLIAGIHSLLLTLVPGLSWGQRALAFILGAGLLPASRHPFRHWPVLLMGLLGQAFFLATAAFGGTFVQRLGALPSLALLPALVWTMHGAWRGSLRLADLERLPTRAILEEARTQDGTSLLSLSQKGPLVLVCLRHFGCVFCQEALSRIARERAVLARQGTRIALLHMSSEPEAATFFGHFGLEDLPRVSDPHRWVYFHLGLRRGGPWQLFGPSVWWRGLRLFLLEGKRLGRIAGDVRQMPGVFLIHHGEVIRAFLSRTAADNPDFRELGTCPPEPPSSPIGA